MLAPRADISIEEAERLIYLEAELLDEWRLDDWLKLYTADMTYLVPSPGMPTDCTPETSLFLIYDDRFRMESRVVRLKKKTAHSEYPHSTNVHMYSNLRVAGQDAEGTQINGVFQVSRYRDGITDIFIGRVRWKLVKQGDDILIRYKRCDLGVDELVPQGRLTIIL
ncbi:MAG: aromatic-ring-hydroxylating dioxygenase subunit beta [Pseudorhodoplanes sp.]